MANTLFSKKLELLRELAPETRTIGFLVNPANPNTVADTADVHAAAGALRLSMLIANASSADGIDAAFTEFVQARVRAVLIGGDPFFLSRPRPTRGTGRPSWHAYLSR